VSGYLQRLVASARTAKPAITPVLGPLFPASLDAGPGLQEVEEEIVVNRPRAYPVAPRPEPAPPPAERLDLPPNSPCLQAEPIAAALPARQTFAAATSVPSAAPEAKPPDASTPDTQPQATLRQSTPEPLWGMLQPAAVFSPPADMHAPPANVRASIVPSEPQPAASGAQRPLLPDAAQRVVLRNVYQPLLAQVSRRPDAAATPGHAPIQKTARTSAAERLERQPDEIQIHIGRIEVTGLPPAAPLPPRTQPPRRALKLDEYLRRGARGRP